MFDKNNIMTLVTIGLTVLMACYHAGNIGRLLTAPVEKRNRKFLRFYTGAMLLMCGLAMWNSTHMNRICPIPCYLLGEGSYSIKTTSYVVEGGVTKQIAFVQTSPNRFKLVVLPSDSTYNSNLKAYVVSANDGSKRIVQVERHTCQFGPDTMTLTLLSERDSAQRFLNAASRVSSVN